MVRMLHQRWRGWIMRVGRRRRRRIAERSAAASSESGGTFGAPSADRTRIKARIAFLIVDKSTIRRRRQRQRQQVRADDKTSTAAAVARIQVAGAFKVVVLIVRRGGSDRSGDGRGRGAGIVAGFAGTARDGALFGAVLARPPPLRFERPRPLLLFRFRPVRVCGAARKSRSSSVSHARKEETCVFVKKANGRAVLTIVPPRPPGLSRERDPMLVLEMPPPDTPRMFASVRLVALGALKVDVGARGGTGRVEGVIGSEVTGRVDVDATGGFTAACVVLDVGFDVARGGVEEVVVACEVDGRGFRGRGVGQIAARVGILGRSRPSSL